MAELKENLSEAEIVAAAKLDYEQFALLYQKYFPKIYTYVFSIVRRHETAEDIVSETFEKAMLKISSYEDRGYSFGAWLYRIARNTALDHVNKHKQMTPLDYESVLIVDPNSAQDIAEEKLTQTELWKAILELDLQAREIIVLRYIEDYSIKEVCQMLGKSEDAVKSAAKRALKRLKFALKVKENDN